MRPDPWQILDHFFANVLREGKVVARRVHYNAFVCEIHSRLHLHSRYARPDEDDAECATVGLPGWHVVSSLARRLCGEPPRSATARTSDIVAEVATSISGGTCLETAPCPGLVAFDEAQITDVADGALIKGVLSSLIASGWVVVTTSNRSPQELAGSTQEQRHPQAAFGQLLEEYCDVHELRGHDYRLRLSPSEMKPFRFPLTEETGEEMDRLFCRLAGGELGAPATIPAMFGRSLQVPRQANGVGTGLAPPRAWGSRRSCPLHRSPPPRAADFTFEQLCCRPLGPSDFVILAEQFHTLILRDIPRLTLDRRDHARRFITLVDQLYNRGVRLFATAEVPPSELFEFSSHNVAVDLEGLEFEAEAGKSAELGALVGNTAAPIDAQPAIAEVGADSRKSLVGNALFTGADERFSFVRAQSRLAEMQSAAYLHSGPRGEDACRQWQ